MGIRVGINGFGRIGRNFFRAQHALGSDLEIVALNDLGDAETMAHLLRYDSTLGPFQGEVELADGVLHAAGEEVRILSERDPAALPWGDLGVDVVLESTGILHRPRRRPEASRRRSEEGRDLGPGDGSRRHDRARRERRHVRPRRAPHRLERLVHDQLRRAAREGAARARRDRVRVHDDDPRVHAGSESAGRAAQGSATRARRGDQPRPDLDRRGEGDRPRPPRAPGEGRRHLGSRARGDRISHRPRRLARSRDVVRRGALRVSGGGGRARSRASSSTPRTRSSRPTSSGTPTRASTTAG